ncbi:MAG: alpha/beta hydrolase-fold protein [Gammaproteobacteria bacterium]
MLLKEIWTWGTKRLEGSWPGSLATPTAVRLSRWGHYGTPLLLLPSAGADSEEVERFGMIEALRSPIEAGRLKVFSLDGLAAHPWLQAKAPPDECARAQRAWEALVSEEVLPQIRTDCRSDDVEIFVAGPAFGACSALALACRYPDVFRGAIAMSMPFSMPVQWPEGRQLTQLRQRFIEIATGEGPFERPVHSRVMAQALSSRGVPNHLDVWGRKYAHAWATWRDMIQKYVPAMA